MRRNGETRQCAECGNDFYIKASEVKRGAGKHCSQDCRLKASYAVAGKVCVSEGCDAPAFCREMCKRHYGQWHYHNLPPEARAKHRAYHKRHYEENREQILERQRRYAEADPEEYRRRTAEAQRRRRARDPQGEREKERRRHIKAKYGLTLEEYDAILARGCAICGTHAGRVTGKRNGSTPPPARLCMDHDHASGKVRAALCHNCNAALGLFGDDPARLRAAAEYLEAHCPTPSSTARI